MSSYRHVGCLSLSFLSSTHFHHLRAREREAPLGKGKTLEVRTQEEAPLLGCCLSLQESMMHSFIFNKNDAAKQEV